jgi:hypothetical protein
MDRKWLPLTLITALACVLGAPTVRGTGPVPPGGLKGEYFNNLWQSGTPVVMRIDPEINFAWGHNPPAPGVNADSFSVRWTGYLTAPVSDTYTFTVQTDDYAWLWIGDQFLGSYWASPPSSQGKIKLNAGQIYSLKVDYRVEKGEAGVQFFWQSPSIPRQIVPAGVLQPPLLAEHPAPADKAVEVAQNVTLQWQTGGRATHHDIYVTDDPNAIAEATLASLGVYRGRQPWEAPAFDTGPLAWGRTYYWRVDEVNEAEPGSPWKGPVWRFTTAADYVPVDDFESYNDTDNFLWNTWIDGLDGNGTNSIVGVTMTEREATFHSGHQSMPFEYNNVDLPYYSEAYRTWDRPQDWTVNGVTDLSLWIAGQPVPLTVESNGNVRLSVSGLYSFWGGSAAQQFGFRQLTGDGQIVARIEAFEGGGFAEAGVMVGDPSDRWKYAAVGVTGEKALCFRRTIDTVLGEQPGISTPHWVKLVRKGDTLQAQHSADGLSWKDIADPQDKPIAVNTAMGKTVCIGLYVTNHIWQGGAAAEFSNITFTGTVSEQWQVTGLGNSPDPLLRCPGRCRRPHGRGGAPRSRGSQLLRLDAMDDSAEPTRGGRRGPQVGQKNVSRRGRPSQPQTRRSRPPAH